jgi:hypothetical protein
MPENVTAPPSEVAGREMLAHSAVHLMATAWQHTGSTDSREAAISLRAMPGWDLGGLPLDFLPNGAIRDRPIRVEKLNPALKGQSEVVFEMQPAEAPPPATDPAIPAAQP